jgi:type IV secretory pathway TrbF-like protein
MKNPNKDGKQRERPYLSEGVYLERYGVYVDQARRWRRVALASLSVAALSSAGLVWLGGQSRLVPYVVEVEKLGQALAVARADQAERPDRRVIVAQLARWIVDVRSVYADAAAQRALIAEGYAVRPVKPGALQQGERPCASTPRRAGKRSNG